MPFRRNNVYRFLPEGDEGLDPKPLCFKVKKGVKERLKLVPEWQNELRRFVDELIEQSSGS